MIIGTETWLRKDINSSEIFPDSYTVYRKDRKDGYGGVPIALTSEYISEDIDIESDTESIFVKISLLSNTSLITGSLYRPPNSDNENMEKIKCAEDDITKNHISSVVWLGGDF
jgi:hypothetical protein